MIGTQRFILNFDGNFELISIILLVALIGAISMARQ